MNCDEYYSYNALAGLVKNSDEEEPARKWDPWELVTEAVSRMKRNGDVMRSDRLKQVMQEIDSTLRREGSRHGEVLALRARTRCSAACSPPRSSRTASSRSASRAVPGAKRRAAENAAADEAARGDGTEAGEDRKREGRGRRGRRGRGGRDREERGPRADRPSAELPLDGEAAAMPETKPHVEIAADGRAARRAGPARARARCPTRSVRTARSAHRAPTAGEQIGITGERLTRDEAFDLVRRSVESLVTGDEAVRASVVRAKARELLGRDSESLSDRNFPRILKDAHDNDVIDLRRRGDDFEIARAAEAESVSDQLAKTAIANAPAPARRAARAARHGSARRQRAAWPRRPSRSTARRSPQHRRGTIRCDARTATPPCRQPSPMRRQRRPLHRRRSSRSRPRRRAKPRAKRAAKKAAGARSENGGARAPRRGR